VIKVFTNESLVLVSHVRNILQQAGIATLVKNERLAGALGEIPYLETWPELWVVEQQQAERARALVAAAMSDGPASSSWVCESCGETHEGQFAACWRCQTAAPA
jgi:rubrerythrin